MSANLIKTSSGLNIIPGTPVSFAISLILGPLQGQYTIFSLIDSLPPLASGSPWVISSISGPYNLTGPVGSQILSIPASTLLGQGIYSVTITANTNIIDAGEVLSNTVFATVGFPGGSAVILQADATASIAICIHGSSKIKLDNDDNIEIRNIQPKQKIIAADGQISEIIEAVECWTGIDNKIFGNCIIFEKDSLGQGIPSERLAIDAGHPISTPDDYKKYGDSSLKPAKLYIDPKKGIYSVTWNLVETLLPGENKRYDLIMKDDSCKAYIANGLVVQARKDRKTPGYQYE